MRRDQESTKVLITVMTYPHPSAGYQELVCTAGVTVDRQWVRLYPVDYRYMPSGMRFHKYQWVELSFEPARRGSDRRKESRRPDLDTLRILGPPLSTKNGWRERRAIIDPMPHHTVNQLVRMYDAERVSLGVVRPARVLDVAVTRVTADWKPKWQALFTQTRLFGMPQKPLRKLPFKFQYVFECEDSEKPHRAMIEDWELGALFLKECKRLRSDEAAAESVRAKYLGELCRKDKDTRFFMGTRFPYNTWLVLGVFWPPKL